MRKAPHSPPLPTAFCHFYLAVECVFLTGGNSEPCGCTRNVEMAHSSFRRADRFLGALERAAYSNGGDGKVKPGSLMWVESASPVAEAPLATGEVRTEIRPDF